MSPISSSKSTQAVFKSYSLPALHTAAPLFINYRCSWKTLLRKKLHYVITGLRALTMLALGIHHTMMACDWDKGKRPSRDLNVQLQYAHGMP